MPGVLWSDDELRASLEAYLFVLRLETADISIAEERLVDLLQNGPLPSRNDTSIRFRMRNISSVMKDLGRPTLSAYPPAVKVGTGVQARIEAMLAESPLTKSLSDSSLQTSGSQSLSAAEARAKAKQALNELGKALEALEPPAGIGHNNPPEPIGSASVTNDLRRAVQAVEGLKHELSLAKPERGRVEDKTDQLVQYGVRRAGWLREQAKKASDKAVEHLVEHAVIYLINAIAALFHLLSYLL